MLNVFFSFHLQTVWKGFTNLCTEINYRLVKKKTYGKLLIKSNFRPRFIFLSFQLYSNHLIRSHFDCTFRGEKTNVGIKLEKIIVRKIESSTCYASDSNFFFVWLNYDFCL